MPLKFFSIAATQPGLAEQELNAFVRGHRIVAIERQFVATAGMPVWCLCVEYLDAALPAGGAAGSDAARKNRVDYKEVLSAEDFARFSRLRDLRKQIAEAEAVPVYAVFTNEQLAAISQQRPQSAAALQRLAGIGEAKSKRYGARVLEVVAQAAGPAAEDPAAAVAHAGPTPEAGFATNGAEA